MRRHRAYRRPIMTSADMLLNHVNNHLTYGLPSYRVHQYGRHRR